MQQPSASTELGSVRKAPDAIGPAFTNLNLLSLAKAKVEQKLAAQPNDALTLRQMGDLHRKLGDFAAASETYRKLKAMDDNAVAACWAWWIGALNGEQLPASAPEEPHPTPFVRFANFLTAAQQDMLLDTVQKGRDHFAPALVGNAADEKKLALDFRTALVAERSVRRQIRPWFVKELDRVVGEVVRHFKGDGIDEWHVELEVTAHPSGGFFRPHQDTGYGRTGSRSEHRDAEPLSHTAYGRSDSRLVTFAYYFHREPKRFAGGDLLLYDTSPAMGGYRAAAFSRIQPVNNSLVLFPSSYFHAVLPVHANDDVFENARFTVNGWLHAPGYFGSRSMTEQAARR